MTIPDWAYEEINLLSRELVKIVDLLREATPFVEHFAVNANGSPHELRDAAALLARIEEALGKGLPDPFDSTPPPLPPGTGNRADE